MLHQNWIIDVVWLGLSNTHWWFSAIILWCLQWTATNLLQAITGKCR